MKYSFNCVKGLILLTFLTFCLQDGLSQCVSNCAIQCVGKVNVSLGQDCKAEITPAMGGVGITQACNSYYSIELYDAHGNPVSTGPTTGSGTGSGTSFPIVTLDHVGQVLTYEVTEPECGNKCWGSLEVEYKIAPNIDCPDDITIDCGALPFLSLPEVEDTCLAYEVKLLSEVNTKLDCDLNFTAIVRRTYIATDDFGNTSTCAHDVTLRRFDFSSVIYPPSTTISCSDTMMRFGPNGAPLPFYTNFINPMTGSGSFDFMGVPFICSPEEGLTDLTCPMTGSGSGIPLIPPGGAIVLKQTGGTVMDPEFTVCDIDGDVINNSQTQLCSAYISYTDVIFDQLPCKTKYLRTWEIREWWCSDENTNGDIQLITVVDDEPPVFTCPSNMTVSTAYNCAGSIELPSVSAVDDCGTEFEYLIRFGNNAIQTNGGQADLALGNNVVTYTVSDLCKNSSTCDFIVTVQDHTEPVAICEANKVVSLSASNNTIVFAEPFDNGSWDECGLDRFEVRRMDSICVAQDTLFGPHVTFCCVDANTEVMVVFRAIDKAGNFNDCMVRVEVQDKSVPALTCPADTTIDCREVYDLNNLSLTFGGPQLGNNCASRNIDEVIIDDIDQCGIGTITRKFQLKDNDGNVLRSCTQIVTITNNTPFVESNIQWPLDFKTSSTCSILDLDPEDLPELFNYPTFLGGEDNCSLLGYDYDDKVFEAVPGTGSCAHIERTWKVINWCGAVNGSFVQYTIPRPQLIEIINTESPVIVPAGPVVLESINVDCTSGLIEIERTATDDCNSLFWSFKVFNIDGVQVHAGLSNKLIHILPVGNYTINWSVNDGCGNSDFDIQDLQIINLKAPTPVCLNGLSANLVLMDTNNDGQVDNEMVELWASDFNAGSSHSCGNPIALSFSTDTTDKFRIFDCNDIGIQEIQLWVTDVLTGAQDFCKTYIDIQDNNGDNFCDPSKLNRVIVDGEVYNEIEERIENVEVFLANNAPSDFTDQQGIYAFLDMPMGGSYNITPIKDDLYLNGVSTFDLVMMQNHILGNAELDSPYKLIAADVNNSGDVTAIDLIELRKLILGIYQELPSNSSWRFVDADFNFPDPLNPWLTDWPETYEIFELTQDMHIDFIGVKIGDINNSATVNLKDSDTETRRNKTLNFEIADLNLKQGEIQKIPFYARDYNGLAGWQTTLSFDPNEIDVLGIEGLSLDLDENIHSNMSTSGLGQIALSYVHKTASDIDDDEVLFEVLVNTKKDVNAKNAFKLNSSLVRSEAYLENRQIVNLSISNSVQEANLESVSPNPWIARTNINFNVPVSGKVKFEFIDVNGQLLLVKEDNYQAGFNTIEINKTEINTSGVVYIKMTTDTNILEYKMIVL